MQQEIKIQAVKRKLVDLGINPAFIDIFGKEVAVCYDELEAKHSAALEAFIKSQNVSHTDWSLFILAA
jgi:hypothetical protein